MKKVVIYPGRFQPMLSHHVKVYDFLKKTFPDHEVYIGTSDIVKEGSPFNYKEKQMIAQAQGIDPNKVLKANQPYVHTFYEQLDHQNTVVIFAVGEKDMGTRFAMNNVDPQTGLDMKVRPNKETGEFEAKYYQMINSMTDNPQTMDKRGYLFEVPNQKDVEGEVESASAFRNALKNSPDKESAKEVFEKQFKEYSEAIFNLVYDNIVGEKMSEDLNILKQLAGLNFDESAPVEFESNVEVNDIEFTPPSKSSSFHSIANRFPQGSDVNDMDVKREEFINALVRSPANLLSEINERISPSDENGLAASEKLNKIISIVEKDGKNLTDLDDDNKSFAIKLVKKAIKEMELSAGDDSEEYDKEEPAEESLDLSDIKADYGVQEDEEEGVGEYSYTLEYNGEENGYSKHILTITNPEGESKVVGDDFTYFDQEGDELQAELESWFHKGMGVADASVDEVNEAMTPQVQNLYQDLKRKDPAMADEFMKQFNLIGGTSIDVAYQKAEKALNRPMSKSPVGNESVDEGRMSDIHQAANEMDKEEFAKAHPEFEDDWESMQNDDDAEDEPRDDGSPAYKKYIGKHKHEESFEESSEDSGEGSISDMSDEELMDYVGQKEEELIDDMQQHIAPDFLHKDNYEETFEKYREEVLEPAAHDISQDAADGMEPADEMEAEESIDNTANMALEAAMEELKKLAGLEEGECPKCGNKKHKLMACSSCGCS